MVKSVFLKIKKEHTYDTMCPARLGKFLRIIEEFFQDALQCVILMSELQALNAVGIFGLILLSLLR